VGAAFLLVGLAFGAAALRGMPIARPSLAIARRRQASVEIG
jgi:hypothetical protein